MSEGHGGEVPRNFSPASPLALVLLAVLPLQIVIGCVRDEPAYQGRPLSEWVAGLHDHDSAFRLRAVRAIGDMGEDASSASDALLSLWDRDEGNRESVEEALLSIDLRKGVLLVLRHRGVQEVGIRSKELIQGRQQEVIPLLIEALSEEEDLIRCNALYLLGGAGTSGADAIPFLPALMESSSTDIRQFSILAAAQIPNCDEKILDKMVALFDDADPRVRTTAIKAAPAFTTPCGDVLRPALEQLLQTAQSPDVTRLIEKALSSMGGGQSPAPGLAENVGQSPRVSARSILGPEQPAEWDESAEATYREILLRRKARQGK